MRHRDCRSTDGTSVYAVLYIQERARSQFQSSVIIVNVRTMRSAHIHIRIYRSEKGREGVVDCRMRDACTHSHGAFECKRV